jgi:hypothetical protein
MLTMTTVLDANVILTRKEFLALPKEQRRELMQYWRSNYSTKKIRKVMGYQNSTAFYNMLKSLDLPTNLAKLDSQNELDTKKNLKNSSGVHVHVVLIGDVDVDLLPELYRLAQQNQLQLKIDSQP